MARLAIFLLHALYWYLCVVIRRQSDHCRESKGGKRGSLCDQIGVYFYLILVPVCSKKSVSLVTMEAAHGLERIPLFYSHLRRQWLIGKGRQPLWGNYVNCKKYIFVLTLSEYVDEIRAIKGTAPMYILQMYIVSRFLFRMPQCSLELPTTLRRRK